jgi:hypothetical protein
VELIGMVAFVIPSLFTDREDMKPPCQLTVVDGAALVTGRMTAKVSVAGTGSGLGRAGYLSPPNQGHTAL